MALQKITDDQLKAEMLKGAPIAEVARKYSIGERTLKRRKADLVARGFDPENGRQHKNPAGQVVSGYSTLVKYSEDDEFGRVLEWVKTNFRVNEQLSKANDIIESLAEDIEPITPISYVKPKKLDKDKFTVLPIGDPHIGLLCWSKEVGEDWDLEIAQRVFKKVFTRLLNRIPDTEECVLVNTGDFFHADNIGGTTSRSGHALDTDGRYGKWLDVGVLVVRMLIEACLKKYKKVTYVNVKGNHDDILGSALGVFCDHLYENQKRLYVMRGESPFQYFYKNKVLIGFSHGHTAKLSALPGKMADDQYKLWGKTTCRHWITGHVHHNSWVQFKEHPGCTVETVGIIPPKDAFSYGGAYGAYRTTQAIIFDSKRGALVDRHIEYVRGDD